MKRIILWCFILSMLLNLFPPVYAAEEQEDTIILTDTFYVPTTRKIHSLQVSFNPSWFRNDARIYNHDLAKLSLGLATSAFRPNRRLIKENEPTDYNLRSFLNQAGFTDLRSDDYNKDPGKKQ